MCVQDLTFVIIRIILYLNEVCHLSAVRKSQENLKNLKTTMVNLVYPKRLFLIGFFSFYISHHTTIFTSGLLKSNFQTTSSAITILILLSFDCKKVE